jgi:hypothetical protein
VVTFNDVPKRNERFGRCSCVSQNGIMLQHASWNIKVPACGRCYNPALSAPNRTLVPERRSHVFTLDSKDVSFCHHSAGSGGQRISGCPS